MLARVLSSEHSGLRAAGSRSRCIVWNPGEEFHDNRQPRLGELR